jgi:hypothetical protein
VRAAYCEDCQRLRPVANGVCEVCGGSRLSNLSDLDDGGFDARRIRSDSAPLGDVAWWTGLACIGLDLVTLAVLFFGGPLTLGLVASWMLVGSVIPVVGIVGALVGLRRGEQHASKGLVACVLALLLLAPHFGFFSALQRI